MNLKPKRQVRIGRGKQTMGKASASGLAGAGTSTRQRSAYELELYYKLHNRREELIQQIREVEHALSQLTDETVKAVLNVISVANRRI